MIETTTMKIRNPPLKIDTVRVKGVDGVIGITSCPGLRDDCIFDLYSDSLVNDLQSIRSWGADIVVTLLEESELYSLGVSDLSKYVLAMEMVWLHLPVRNMSVPDEDAEEKWRISILCLCNLLRQGQRVVVHCREGVGRAGLIAARLVIGLGVPAAEAVRTVQKARPGALLYNPHVRYCHSLSEKMNITAPEEVAHPSRVNSF